MYRRWRCCGGGVEGEREGERRKEEINIYKQMKGREVGRG